MYIFKLILFCVLHFNAFIAAKIIPFVVFAKENKCIINSTAKDILKIQTILIYQIKTDCYLMTHFQQSWYSRLFRQERLLVQIIIKSIFTNGILCILVMGNIFHLSDYSAFTEVDVAALILLVQY